MQFKNMRTRLVAVPELGCEASAGGLSSGRPSDSVRNSSTSSSSAKHGKLQRGNSFGFAAPTSSLSDSKRALLSDNSVSRLGLGFFFTTATTRTTMGESAMGYGGGALS